MYKIDLQNFIKKNKLTQKGLAKILGVGQPFISQIIKGKSHLSSEKIEFLLNAGEYDTSMIMEVSADDLPSDTVTMSREVFDSIQKLIDTINSQQRTMWGAMPKRQILPAVQMPCSIFRRKALCITQILTPYRDIFGTKNV